MKPSPGALARRLLVAGCATAAAGLLTLGASSSPAAEPGTLVVTKQVTEGTGPDAGIFIFSGSWGESFGLAAGGSRTTYLAEGQYTVIEQPEPGYEFLGIACSGPAGSLAFSGPQASVPVAAGQATSCTSTSKPRIDIDVDPEVTGNARLTVKRSCSNPARLVATVRAGNASRVSFRVNHRWVKTVNRPATGKLFRLVTRVGRGAVPVSARVRFVPGASPREARLSRRVPLCLEVPAFAGRDE